MLPKTQNRRHVHYTKSMLSGPWNESCHKLQWVMSHMWMSQITYDSETSYVFLDGYCSTVQGLLDWFEVGLGFTKLLFIQTDLCVMCVFVLYAPLSLSYSPFLDILHYLHRAVGVPLESALNLVGRKTSYAMSHVTGVNVSCNTCEWVMSPVWMCHVTLVNVSCHTCEWVMSHTPVKVDAIQSLFVAEHHLYIHIHTYTHIYTCIYKYMYA